MNISQLSEDYKQYILVLSNGSEYKLNGKQKETIVNSVFGFATLPNGSVINKSFIVEFKLNMEETRDFVSKNKDKIIK